jgi:hypothetical protein
MRADFTATGELGFVGLIQDDVLPALHEIRVAGPDVALFRDSVRG